MICVAGPSQQALVGQQRKIGARGGRRCAGEIMMPRERSSSGSAAASGALDVQAHHIGTGRSPRDWQRGCWPSAQTKHRPPATARGETIGDYELGSGPVS